MAMLERLIEHVISNPWARFARMGDVAEELAAGAVY
jgi:hypothetical protein